MRHGRSAWRTYPALALTLAFALSACSGGHSSVPSGVPAQSGGGATVPLARGSGGAVYGANMLAGATYLGPAKLQTVGLDVWVTMGNAEGLQLYAAQANDPASPLYRHWLTPAEIGSRFGAAPGDYQKVVQYLNNYGIAVETFPQRQMMRIRGPQAGVEAALGISLGIYTKGKQTFMAPKSAPALPAGLKIAGMTALVGYRAKTRDFVPVQAGNGILQGYSPQQIANAFDYTGAYAAGYTGTGITIGVIGTGPISDGDVRLGTGGQGDVAEYRALFGVSGSGTITQVFSTNANVSPGNPSLGPGGQFSLGLATPPPATSPNNSACVAQGVPSGNSPTDYTTCNPEDIEAQLDTEQAAGLAPNANVQFYIAYNPNECYSTGTYTAPAPCPGGLGLPTPQLGIGLTDDEIQEAIGTGTADIITMSFGGDEPDALGYYYSASGTGFGPSEFAALNAEGVAVFASSGDDGAQGCIGSNNQPNPNTLCVSYPATDPNVVSVGGVNTPLDSSGHLTGPITGWGQQTIDFGSPGASGGGCSQTFPLPPYEGSLTPADPCVALTDTRSQPDISLDADLNTGVAVVSNAPPILGGRSVVPIGGTSAAAPEAAAMWALVLSACKVTAGCSTGPSAHPYRLGNPNKFFYKIYQNKLSTYAAVFYDVLYGYNGFPYSPYPPEPSPVPTFASGYTAGPGLDLVTGIGVPYARNLIKAVTGG